MDKCSFCGRDKKDTNLLIAGLSGHICDRCIEQAHDIVLEELQKKGDFDVNQNFIKKLKLTNKGKFLADGIASDLFMI